MKRMTTLLLTLLLILTLGGCSHSEPKITVPTEPAIVREELAALSETVIFDKDGLKLTATGLTQTAKGGEVGIIFENNTSANLSFSADALIVNGITTDNGFCVTAGANESVHGVMKVSFKSLDASHMTNIATIESVDARIFETEEFATIHNAPFRLETSLAGTYTPTLASGTVTYDKDGLTVTALGIYPGKYNTTVKLLITNDTDKNIAIKGINFTSDGITVTGWLFENVYSGTSRYVEYSLHGIVKEAGVNIGVYSLDDNYEQICTTGTSKIS